jgi:4-amino-4-deoxy-L-arabinose transferase-like glycosyltransferase
VTRPSWWVGAILAFAFVLRLGYVLHLHGVEPKDPEDYDSYAWNLAQGNGYTNGESLTRRPPLFPFLLAGVYTVAGHSPRAARLLQITLGTALCAVVYLIGTRLYGVFAGRLAAIAAAVYPYFIYYSGYLMTETLAALVFGWLAYLWLGWDRDTRPTRFFSVGLVAGLAILARPVFLLIPGLVPLWALAARLSLPRAATATIWFAAGAAAVVAPWTMRNYVATGHFIPVQTDGSRMLYQFTVWYADPSFPTFEPEKLAERAAQFKAAHREMFDRMDAMSETERDAAGMRDFLAFVREQPAAYLRATLRKLYWFWRPSDFAMISTRVVRLDAWFAGAIFWPLLVLAPIGLLPLTPLRRWTLVLFVLYLSALHSLVFQGTPRYRFPLYPQLLAMSAGGVGVLWSRFRPVRERA